MGGGVVGSGLVNGVNISGVSEDGEDSFYNLNNGYAATTGSVTASVTGIASRNQDGTWNDDDGSGRNAQGDRLIRFDPDLCASGTCAVGTLALAGLRTAQFNEQDDISIVLTQGGVPFNTDGGNLQIRRLTMPDYDDPAGAPPVNLLVTISGSPAGADSKRRHRPGWECHLRQRWRSGAGFGSAWEQ